MKKTKKKGNGIDKTTNNIFIDKKSDMVKTNNMYKNKKSAEDNITIDDIFTGKNSSVIKKNNSMKKKNKEKPNAIIKEKNIIENKNIISNKTKNNVNNNAVQVNCVVKEKTKFDIRGNNSETRKYTEDGYPIYQLNELNIKLSEDVTEECPFDCSCCY